MPKSGVSNTRSAGQNQPGKDSTTQATGWLWKVGRRA